MSSAASSVTKVDAVRTRAGLLIGEGRDRGRWRTRGRRGRDRRGTAGGVRREEARWECARRHSEARSKLPAVLNEPPERTNRGHREGEARVETAEWRTTKDGLPPLFLFVVPSFPVLSWWSPRCGLTVQAWNVVQATQKQQRGRPKATRQRTHQPTTRSDNGGRRVGTTRGRGRLQPLGDERTMRTWSERTWSC